MDHIVIIGNGIAGITAARHIRKNSRNKITVVSGESEYFYSRTALMYIYMGHMTFEHTKPYEDSFWKKNRIDLVMGWISNIDFAHKKLIFKDNTFEPIQYDKLILALGSKPNFYGWPGQTLQGVQGLYSLQDLEKMEQSTQNINHAVIVGGGLIGIEMAEMLHSRHIQTTFLVRESSFWNNILPPEESVMINDEIIDHEIDLRLATGLKEIIGDDSGNVVGVITDMGEKLACQFVGITTGVTANIDLVRDTEIAIDKGILVNEFLETSIADVFAIGDCAQLRNPLPHRRAIEQVWYTSRMMGETVALTITGRPTAYKPGVWFNSAKFFNLEYQTYGNVPAATDSDQASFCWQSDDKKKMVRINYNRHSKQVTGVNTIGIRMRHEQWDKWLNDCKSIFYIVANLDKAMFDPEFYRNYTSDIQELYKKIHPNDHLEIKSKSFFSKLLGV